MPPECYLRIYPAYDKRCGFLLMSRSNNPERVPSNNDTQIGPRGCLFFCGSPLLVAFLQEDHQFSLTSPGKTHRKLASRILVQEGDA